MDYPYAHELYIFDLKDLHHIVERLCTLTSSSET